MKCPATTKLDTYLHAYIDSAQLAGDDKGFLFRTAIKRTGELSERPMSQADAYRMIRRRAGDAGIATKMAYLKRHFDTEIIVLCVRWSPLALRCA
jgi:hypothetical protein